MYRFKATLLKFIFLLFSFINYSQENFTISGYVLDKDSNESIIGANIIIPSINSGTITNTYGFFSITLLKKNYAIEISSIGYENISTKINLLKNINTTFFLSENIENLEEVVVIKDVEEIDITKPLMSLNIMSNSSILRVKTSYINSRISITTTSSCSINPRS